MEAQKYKRVLIKISGEALAGDKHFGLNFDVIGPVCDVIKKCNEEGCEIGIVVGGGNFMRGVKDGVGKMERTPRGPHGHAGNHHQRTGSAGCTGAARRGRSRTDRYRDEQDR